MLKLYPSTIAFINLCFNTVVRAIAVAIAFTILLAIYILLHYLLNYVLGIANASDTMRERLSPLALVVPVITAIVIALTGIGDLVNLLLASLKIPYDHRHTGSEDED